MPGFRKAGIASIQTAAATGQGLRPQITTGNLGHNAYITEIGISHNGAANDTSVPPSWELVRSSASGSGGDAASALQPLLTHIYTTFSTDYDNSVATAAGTEHILHHWYVPTVSGMIWVAAPGREIDVDSPAENHGYVGLHNEAALPASISANNYIIVEE